MDYFHKLGRLGFEVHQGRVTIKNDFDCALYVHHREVPIFVCALAIADGNIPISAVLDFAGYSFESLVVKRPSLDWMEAGALCAACEVKAANIALPSEQAFNQQLRHTISALKLDEFFQSVGEANTHYNIRPSGFDFENLVEDASGMRQWKSSYRQLSSSKQMMVATVIWLYRGDTDKHWLGRVPRKWTAFKAIQSLRDEGLLEMWARLVSLYPGW